MSCVFACTKFLAYLSRPLPKTLADSKHFLYFLLPTSPLDFIHLPSSQPHLLDPTNLSQTGSIFKVAFKMYLSAITSVFMAVLLTCASAQSTGSLVTGALGNATVVENNPPGSIYVATLPTTEFFNPDDPRGNIKGSVSATANPDGIGVSFQVNFSNLPTSGGPFLYHLHASPVPSDGNCTGTLGHVDPFLRGETPPCDSDFPQTCQVGDLAGKHGKITSDPFTASYVDDFASTVEGLGSFFGNRSITVHFGNATRITCANFALLEGSVGGSDNITASATSSSGPAQFTGLGAASFSVSPMLYWVLIGALALTV